MSFTQRILTLSWLVRDTFRQSLASGVCWLLLGLSTLCIVVCLSISTSGVQSLKPAGANPDFLPRFDPDAGNAEKLKQSGVVVADGRLHLAFGAIEVPLGRDTRGGVHFLELLLAGGVADTLGLLLALVWTAGFLPQFLDPRSISVLLAKPAPRWCLLMGKYLGVLAFVAAHATLFVGGTWLAIGLKTGVWDCSYLLCVPLLLLHFSIFFAFSLLLAVCTRSTVSCVFGSIAFWAICWGMNYGRHLAAGTRLGPDAKLSTPLMGVVEAGYWILPKPADLGMVLYDALGARDHFSPLLTDPALFSFGLSIATSLAFASYLLWAASRQFAATDY
ncbi:MAG TPA: ABC transporter permease subunit [Pirellulales bacterium]|jgi:ABC-type transport system involved in multi-copper enzyme maturation permease subunit|nr:ABC transporter permease subunit [Pirellulales bacterium]